MMQDREFSAVGSEFSNPGREFLPPGREWNAPHPEMDTSGREYRQRSVEEPPEQKKRRFNPAMLTAAAVVSAAVVITPISRSVGRTNYPTTAPSAQSQAYLDRVWSAIEQEDLDSLPELMLDPQLLVMMEDEISPYAHMLEEQYGAQHVVCVELESDPEAEIQGKELYYHVDYDGQVFSYSGTTDSPVLSIGNLGYDSNEDWTSRAMSMDLTEGISGLRPREGLTVMKKWAWVNVYDTLGEQKEAYGFSNAGVTFGSGRFVYRQDPEESDSYFLVLEEGKTIHREIHQNNTSYMSQTVAQYIEERTLEGTFVPEWVEYESGSYFTDYLENGTVRYTRQGDGGSYDVELKVVNGVLQPTDEVVVKEHVDGGNRYYYLYFTYQNDYGDVTEVQMEGTQADSEEDYLYHLFARY